MIYLVNSEFHKARIGSIYSNSIYYVGNQNDPSFIDLVNTIRGTTNGSVNIHTDLNQTKGIFLIPYSTTQPDGQVFDVEATVDKFTIWYSEGLLMSSGFNSSLANGIYYLLNSIGIEWLTSNPNGLHVPNLLAQPIFSRKTVNFSFRDRTEFGTGGNDNKLNQPWENVDGLSYRQAWDNWKRRTGWGYDYATAGHMGGAFYSANAAKCDDNWNTYGANSPESWFNSLLGKINGRIKIEVPAAVQIFKDYIRTRYNLAVSQNISFIVLGVDPEDGRGGSDDPLPPDGFQGITGWNHADKWMWLANAVAADYLNNPNVKISIQSYGDGPTNALAPKFNLLPNVLPNLNPYAFQKAYFPPDTMLDAWAPKITGDASIYDYVNITQWSVGRPNQHNLASVEYKLKLWNQKKIKGMTYETMDATCIAHFHYCANALQKDITLTMSTVFDSWLTKMFGPAKEPMRRMITRWQTNYQGAADSSISLADLQEASNLVPVNSVWWNRISDYKAYIHYIILLDNHDGTEASKNNIFTYMYSIYHTMMIQVPAFIGQNYIPPFTARPTGSTVQHLTPQQIETQFQTDLTNNPKLYDIVPFNFDFNKVGFVERLNDSVWKYGRNPNWFFNPTTPNNIVFYAGSSNSVQLSIFTADGIVLQQTIDSTHYDIIENDIPSGNTYYLKLITIPVIPGKTYYCSMRGGWGRIKSLSDHIFWLNNSADNFDNYQLPIQYIYIPTNATELVVESNQSVVPSAALATSPTWTTMSTLINNIRRIAIAPADRGKLWKIAWGDSYGRVLNLPNITALNKFIYTE